MTRYFICSLDPISLVTVDVLWTACGRLVHGSVSEMEKDIARMMDLPLALQKSCLYDDIDIKNMQNTMFLRSNSSDNISQRVTSMLTPHGFRSIEGHHSVSLTSSWILVRRATCSCFYHRLISRNLRHHCTRVSLKYSGINQSALSQ